MLELLHAIGLCPDFMQHGSLLAVLLEYYNLKEVMVAIQLLIYKFKSMFNPKN